MVGNSRGAIDAPGNSPYGLPRRTGKPGRWLLLAEQETVWMNRHQTLTVGPRSPILCKVEVPVGLHARWYRSPSAPSATSSPATLLTQAPHQPLPRPARNGHGAIPPEGHAQGLPRKHDCRPDPAAREQAASRLTATRCRRAVIKVQPFRDSRRARRARALFLWGTATAPAFPAYEQARATWV